MKKIIFVLLLYCVILSCKSVKNENRTNSIKIDEIKSIIDTLSVLKNMLPSNEIIILLLTKQNELKKEIELWDLNDPNGTMRGNIPDSNFVSLAFYDYGAEIGAVKPVVNDINIKIKYRLIFGLSVICYNLVNPRYTEYIMLADTQLFQKSGTFSIEYFLPLKTQVQQFLSKPINENYLLNQIEVLVEEKIGKDIWSYSYTQPICSPSFKYYHSR